MRVSWRKPDSRLLGSTSRHQSACLEVRLDLVSLYEEGSSITGLRCTASLLVVAA